MPRKMPDYDVNALKESIKITNKNITRVLEAIKKIQKRNEHLKAEIIQNDKKIKIFHQEIGRLEQDKLQLKNLIAQIKSK